MLKKLLISASFVGLMAIGGSAQASFPFATGTCQNHVCIFNNDTIKTRSVGTKEFVVEQLNTGIELPKANSERGPLTKVGDTFRDSFSARTLSQIYAGNDTFVTDQRGYDRALSLYNRGVARNNRGLMRAGEVQGRNATATGGTIIAVIGERQPFQLFPTVKQQVPGTSHNPVLVGSNPGNVFAPGVRELGAIRPGRTFNAKFYDMLSDRYDRQTRLVNNWTALREKRLRQIAHYEASGKAPPRWLTRHLERINSRIDRWTEASMVTAQRAIGLVAGGSSVSSIDHALERLLGFSFDPSKLTSLVGLDIDRNFFEQFYPAGQDTGNYGAFSYVSLITDKNGKTFIGFGVVSQHHTNRYHGV